MSVDPQEIERDVESARQAHRALLARMHVLSDAAQLSVTEASRLPGWSRGHVLTHLARNADGHRRMIEAAARGKVADQYDGGVESRDREIEAGARRPVAVVLDDLVGATDRLEAAWASTTWQGSGRRTLAGESPISRLPFLRLREVSLHSVDLDIGVELGDLDPLYVRLELRRMEMSWTARQPMGMTPLPGAALALSATDRLGWLTGRLAVEGLAPAGIF